MSDLVSRVLSAIEQREAVARGAKPGPWRRDYHAAFMHNITAADGTSLITGGLMGSPDVNHVRLNDPTSVLRLCQSLRDIVAMCVEVIGDFDLSTYGQFGVLRHHRNALAVTLAVETLLNTARGLGIEDTPDSGETP